MLISVFGMEKGGKYVEKRENAGYQYFSFCHNVLKRFLIFGFYLVNKTRHCVERVQENMFENVISR